MNVTGSAATLADTLKAFRSDARLSQDELAERAGVSARTVSDIECGIARAPRATTLALLADALGLGAADRARLRAAVERPRRTETPVEAAAALERRPLPAVAALIGRDADTAAALALLHAGTRLLTLVGPPGVGKTSLALRIAHEAGAAFPGGTAFIDLAPLADVALVPAKIAVALGVRDVAGESLAQTLQRAPRGGAMLLILDTFEHLAGAAPFLAQLLAAVPALAIVVTSRAPLHLDIEREFAVRPLALPDPQRTYAAAELAAVPAVALLVERARASRRDFTVTPENAAALIAVCRALDGIPLALELVAPRLKVFSPAALVARLDRRLPLLESDRADGSARHRSMRSALAWSYERLSPPEQAVFRRLGVFRGTFSVDAARAVADAAVAEAGVPVLHVLAVLVEQQLLHVDERDGEPYFALPELIREFAFDALAATADVTTVQAELLAYCIAIAPRVKLAQPADERRRLMQRLERESASFDGLFAWARAGGRFETGLRLAHALWAFWYLRGSSAEGLRWVTAFIADAERAALALPEDVLANAYRQIMSLAAITGDLEIADRAAARAREIIVRGNDARAIAWISDVAGVIASQRGDYVRAEALLSEGLRLRRELGDMYEIGNSLQDLGHSVADSGDLDRARALLDEAIAWYRRVDGTLGEGEAQQILGTIALREGDGERAEIAGREALRIGGEHGHAMLGASARMLLGHTALRRGKRAETARFFRDALATFVSASFADVPDAVDGLAAVAHAASRSREAARLLAGASALRAKMRKRIAPADRAAHDALVAAVAAALEPLVFDAESTIGATLAPAQLIADARAVAAAVTLPEPPIPG